MKLLTKKISNKIPNLYEQEGKGEDAMVYVKFFLPGTRWTWYATEFNTRDIFLVGWKVEFHQILMSWDIFHYQNLKKLILKEICILSQNHLKKFLKIISSIH